jgi:3-deoxy-D-manno-octulosonate 8-phosphate phosphatase (KDO 8-P phosphatase)
MNIFGNTDFILENYKRIAALKLIVFDFDGVFTDNTVLVTENGYESVKCYRGDGIGIDRLRNSFPVEMCIISSETNSVVARRCEKLKIKHYTSPKSKKETLLNIIKENGIKLDEVMFVGNDLNDVECMKIVGIPVAVNDAITDILPCSAYRTANKGGHGAVREVCDLVYFCKKIISQEK